MGGGTEQQSKEKNTERAKDEDLRRWFIQDTGFFNQKRKKKKKKKKKKKEKKKKETAKIPSWVL